MRSPWNLSEVRRDETHSNRWLRRRIAGALLFVSSVPFLLLGAGAWLVFGNLANEQTLTLQRNLVRAHAVAIDLYLSEKLRMLELIAETSSLEELKNPGRLQTVFGAVAGVQGDGFVDMGIIDQEGRHLAYVGPYDLMEKTYDQADWFRTVMAEREVVSDVFLGFRQVPHSIIAIRQPSPTGWWILRSTLDNRSLYDLVRSLEVGEEGDVFLVNREGLFQTPPREGEVLTPSSLPQVPVHPDVRDERVREERGTIHQVTTWLNDGRWLLVVQQPEREILAPVHRAVLEGGLMATLAMVLVFLATIVITSRLIRRVDEANLQKDQMYGDLMRSAKLASLGEMSAGLAHEINNPLAIISAEQTNLEDGLDDLDVSGDSLAALKKSVDRCKRQVDRCGKITAKMLQFGRKTDTALRATETEPVLREIGVLLERRAQANNADLQMELEPGIPPAWLDPNELEQVLANLVNNAVDAVGVGGVIRISAQKDGDHLVLQVKDNGSGITPENLDRVFHPFFTTKPVGKGTGLGMAVVYGIVRGWGGTIQVASDVGVGTTITMRVPLATEAQPSPG